MAGKTIGDKAADLIAGGVIDRALGRQLQPSGAKLARNRGKYGERKRARGVKIGVGLYGDEVGGDMLSFAEVRGRVIITSTGMSMYYGVDSESEEKAEWFQDPTRPGQPARPFYDLNRDIERDLDRMFDEEIDGFVDDLMGGI